MSDFGTRWLAAAAAGLALTACMPETDVPKVVERPVIDVATPGTAKPIQFRTIAVKVKRGEKIGTVAMGLSCLPSAEFFHRGAYARFEDEELSEVFRDELTAANYTVVGDSTAVFEDPDDWKAEYLIAGTVRKMIANVCYPRTDWGDVINGTGEGFLEVAWQVYNRLDRKVVYEVTTQGRGEVEDDSPYPDSEVFARAFAQATRNLLAEKDFHDLMTGNRAVETAAQPGAGVVIRSRPLFATPIADHMDAVRLNVATVFAGDGHGSGYFIDDEGHLLTNEHVVRGARFVKVQLVTGREVLGEVLATDARRDVALVETESVGVDGLPLQLAMPGPGTEVYAIGSPYDEDFQGTLTRGVVSANRTIDGLDFIQSDAATYGGSSGGPLVDASGNVVGMTVSGVESDGVPTAINFFIPLADALRQLGIAVQQGGA